MSKVIDFSLSHANSIFYPALVRGQTFYTKQEYIAEINKRQEAAKRDAARQDAARNQHPTQSQAPVRPLTR